MEIKRPRLAFSLQKKQGKVCSAFQSQEETEVADEELPKAAVQEAKVEDFTQQTKSSSERFERYRQSLGARHGPLFRRFAALLNGERGTSGSAQSTASPGLLTATVSAMVQLADLRLQGDEAGLVTAALELFEVLCSAVQELPQDLPPEAFMDGLRQRWRLGESSSEDEWGTYAARAAELFRLKDTVASLYAWSLLPRSTAVHLLKTLKDEIGQVPCILDPIAGTGLHGVLLRNLGAEVILADSVHGGSTQCSGADTQYLQQCISSGSSARAAAAAAAAAANAAVAAGPAVVWAQLEHLDVFDDGQVATEWWARHGEASNAVLMLSFPPPPPSEVAEAALRRFPGKWLLFLGEWRGCTGSAGFFNLLEAGWSVLKTFDVPRWPMMEDKAFFLKRMDSPHSSQKERGSWRCADSQFLKFDYFFRS